MYANKNYLLKSSALNSLMFTHFDKSHNLAMMPNVSVLMSETSRSYEQDN